MNTAFEVTREILRQETHSWRGTGAVSEEARGTGFMPAFKDTATGKVYLARFANGTPAPMHLLEGLPEELVVRRSVDGRTIAVKGSIIAGFLHSGRFFTREQTAAQVACECD